MPFTRNPEPALHSEISVYVAARKASASRLSSNRKSNRPQDGSNGKKTILLFGLQRELALYRAEVLAMKGYNVLIPRNNEEAGAAIRAGGYHVAVLSYTLPDHTVREMAELIRQECPDCPLLMITQRAEHDPHLRPDAIILAELGPSALIEAIQRTLHPPVQ